MKLDVLRKIIREEVKGAIQEELKDILLEAVKSSKPMMHEAQPQIQQQPQAVTKSKEQLRESYRNILGDTAANFNSSKVTQPLRVTSTDTASPNGQLPDGDVPMDMIMGLMNR